MVELRSDSCAKLPCKIQDQNLERSPRLLTRAPLPPLLVLEKFRRLISVHFILFKVHFISPLSSTEGGAKGMEEDEEMATPTGAGSIWAEGPWGRLSGRRSQGWRTRRGGAQGAGNAGGGDETRESPLGMPSSHGAAKRAGSLLRSWGEEGGGGGSGGNCDYERRPRAR